MDILVANAGICTINPLETITKEVFDDTFNTNVKGVLFGVQKALPIFTDGGSIIIIGSVASIKGYESMSVYCASKAALPRSRVTKVVYDNKRAYSWADTTVYDHTAL